MTPTFSRRLTTSFIVALSLVVTGAAVLSASQISRPRQTTTAPVPSIPADQAGTVAGRLYLAVLGREADAPGLRGATSEIQRGRINNQVAAMVGSAEFREGTQQRPAADILQQFYRGLLGRNPDPAGTNAFLPRLGRGEYTGVILEMLGSSEFRETLGLSTGGGATAVPNRLEAALGCQARVLAAVNDAVPGRVFLSFDRMPETSQDLRVVSGAAVDRFDNDRAMTYRCEGTAATYYYNDRQSARGADIREPFASVAVNNCLNAASNEFGGAQIQGAALSASDTRAEYVLGLAVSDTRSVSVVCELDGMRVVNVRRR